MDGLVLLGVLFIASLVFRKFGLDVRLRPKKLVQSVAVQTTSAGSDMMPSFLFSTETGTHFHLDKQCGGLRPARREPRELKPCKICVG